MKNYKQMNKVLSVIIIIILFVISCKKEKTTVLPDDLASLQTLIKEKKNEVLKLQNSIKKIQNKIDSIQPELKRKPVVDVLKVKKSKFAKFSEIQGTVQSDDVIKVSAEIPGRLVGVYVDDGDKVRKGQLIAKLDVSDISNKMEELKKSYELAQDVYERQKRLWDQNIGSEMQYLSAKNNKERLEKAIASIKHQLSKANIYAPAYGVIDSKRVEPGEIVSPGYPLMLILNTRKIKVIADAPESYLKSVKQGDIINIKFPAINYETKNKISRIGSTINPANRTFAIEVKMNNPKNMLKPNLLAILLINDLSLDDVIVIPSDLIQYEISGKPFVMIVKEGNKATKQYVEIGEDYDGKTVINSGLNEGNTLITKGARSIVEGELVDTKMEQENK